MNRACFSTLEARPKSHARGMRGFSVGSLVVLIAVLTAACGEDVPPLSPMLKGLAEGIRPEAIEKHVRALAADEMEGRGTGSDGYLAAADYVAGQFESMGFTPAGGDGGWFQSVPLMRVDPVPAESALVLHQGDVRVELEPEVDWLSWGDFSREAATIRAPAVYVGFGVTAHELDYDDYAGLDVTRKIVVLFRGAPPQFPVDQRAHHSSSREKAQNAARRGAVGVIEIATPADRERFSWSRMVGHSHMGSMRWLDDSGRPDGVQDKLFVEAVLSDSGMERLFESAAKPLDEVIDEAEAGQPRGFDLEVEIEARTLTRHRLSRSPNVVAKLEAAHAAVTDETFVVVTAHLDHLGIGDPVDGDGIYNGAYDNASGVAAMIEIARALTGLPEPPATRSILFVATTGEEKGLLGADYFVKHAPVEVDQIIAEINLDMLWMLHPLRDVIAFGAEHSSLDGPLQLAAAQLGIEVSPDPVPEEGVFSRSDQYPFVRQGIPALFVSSGFKGGDGGITEGKWLRTVYHTPRDDMNQTFDFSAGADLARLNMLVLWYIASAESTPTWNEGDFFGETFGRTPGVNLSPPWGEPVEPPALSLSDPWYNSC